MELIKDPLNRSFYSGMKMGFHLVATATDTNKGQNSNPNPFRMPEALFYSASWHDRCHHFKRIERSSRQRFAKSV